MTTLLIETTFDCSIETCFDLARSIDAHVLSTSRTNEKVVAGRLSGLCEAGDRITWEATHFGIRQRLTSEITRMEKPTFFEDQMIRGAFNSMRHEHHFSSNKNQTIMKDIFQYEVPYGLVGRLFDHLILKNYVKRFLIKRNEVLKQLAENSHPHL